MSEKLKPGERLVDAYRIDEAGLARRREFVRLGEEERRLIAKLEPWAAKAAARVAREFYDWQFAFKPTRDFFERIASEKGIQLPVLRETLEQAQAEYFKDIFRGAQESWGASYFERRLQVGRAHNRINLPLKWYIGSYAEYHRLIRLHLVRSYWWNLPFAFRAYEVILRVINYDIQAVADAFSLNLLEACGIDIRGVKVEAGTDVAEHMDRIKESIGWLLAQAEALAGDNLGDPVLDRPVGGALGDMLGKMIASMRSLARQMEKLASGEYGTERLFEEFTRGKSLAAAALSASAGRSRGTVGSLMADMEASLGMMGVQARLIAEGRIRHEALNENPGGELGDAFKLMTDGLRALVTRADEISEGKLQSALVEKQLAGGMELAAAAESAAGGGMRGDLADAFNRMLVELRKLTVQAKLIAADDLYNHVLDVRIPGELGEAFFRMTDNLRRLARAAEKLAEGDLTLAIERVGKKGALSDAFGNIIEISRELAAGGEKVAGGDLAVTIRIRGEKDVLANAFARMLQNLKSLVVRTKESVLRTATSAEEIGVVSQKSLSAVREHQARMEDIAAAVTELASAVQEVASNSAQADAGTKKITGHAARSREIMESSLKALEGTEAAVQETVREMAQLNQNSRRVGEVVKTIESIAAQTNMLALNAAIEAARAGEVGSGFAVVADEVRKLAEKTASEAGNITTIIESIGEGSAKTLAAIERTAKVAQETAELSAQTGKALEEILVAADQASRGSSEIRIATDQQAKAADEVAGAMERLSHLVKESATAFQQLGAESSKLSVSAQDLTRQISQFKTGSEQ